MSSTDRQLLEHTFIRLTMTETDEDLQSFSFKYLPSIIQKMDSQQENVRPLVIEMLTHLNRRLKLRAAVQLPIEALLLQYQDPAASSFSINFIIIYLKIGFPRLPVEKQIELFPSVINCLKNKPETHKDKLMFLILPIIGRFAEANKMGKKYPLDLEDLPTKRYILTYLTDVLLLPYGLSQTVTTVSPPPAISIYSVTRLTTEPLKPEELQQLKVDIVKFLSCGSLTPNDALAPLVVASADTRFNVVNSAVTELGKISLEVDWTNSSMCTPLYMLFCGSLDQKILDRIRSPADPRVKQKVLQFLLKVRGEAINITLGIRVVFEGLFSVNTNQKCKKLSLEFAELMITSGNRELFKSVITVLLNGIYRKTGPEDTVEIRVAAYKVLWCLASHYPNSFQNVMQIVMTMLDKLPEECPEIQSSMKDVLVALAKVPQFRSSNVSRTSSSSSPDNKSNPLFLALLKKHIESESYIAAYVSSVYLTTCFYEHCVKARYLLLLGFANSELSEKIMTDLYGTHRKEQIDYSSLKSIDLHMETSQETQTTSIKLMPSFTELSIFIFTESRKRLESNSTKVYYKSKPLPFAVTVYDEILDYLRLCLLCSAGVTGPRSLDKAPDVAKFIRRQYTQGNVEAITNFVALSKELFTVTKGFTPLSCLLDIIGCVPDILCKENMNLVEPLQLLLKEPSEDVRETAATLLGILTAWGIDDIKFNSSVRQLIADSKRPHTLELQNGYTMAFSYALNSKLFKCQKSDDIVTSDYYKEAVTTLIAFLHSDNQLLLNGACYGLSLLGRAKQFPLDVGSEEDLDEIINTKYALVKRLFDLMKNPQINNKGRQRAIRCLGYISVGEIFPWRKKIIDNFLEYKKQTKDVDIHIAIGQSLVNCVQSVTSPEGRDPWSVTELDYKPTFNSTDQAEQEELFNYLVLELLSNICLPHPNLRQACCIWLLALCKQSPNHPAIQNRMQLIQEAFTDLLSDDSDIIQDTASRGLGIVFMNSNPELQTQLANGLLEQLTSGKRSVQQITENTAVYENNSIGKDPTGGSLTTYKELCSLASDLNQPDLIYKFMQLANHNANWNSKLGAAFGIQSIAVLAKEQIQAYLPLIIPRLFRYKFDPNVKIQNSMTAIWFALVQDQQTTVAKFYNPIMDDILKHINHHQWRVRMSCCLALEDLLRTHPLAEPDQVALMWHGLFRVMDDYHEATRQTAEKTVKSLSRICVTTCNAERSNKLEGLAASILPIVLGGITHNVLSIRQICLTTTSELIQVAGPHLKPHMPTLIPALLTATGELESSQLNYLSTYYGAQQETQEALDYARATAAKHHSATKTMAKCIEYMDNETIRLTNPHVYDLMKSSVTLGSRVACTHYLTLLATVKKVDFKENPKDIARFIDLLIQGLSDRNAATRKCYADCIGNMIGVAKESTVKKCFEKLFNLYFTTDKNNTKSGIARALLAINKSENEKLRDNSEKVIPLVFFAMHGGTDEEYLTTIDMWKNTWEDICSGDAEIRRNAEAIIALLRTNLESPHWSVKAQAANGINTLATRLGTTLEPNHRQNLVTAIISGLKGRTWEGKDRLLTALASLCAKNNGSKLDETVIVDALMRESKKTEPIYQKIAISTTGDVLESLKVDRFEELYLIMKPFMNMKIVDMEKNEDTVEDRNKSRADFSALKDISFETIGKAWPENKKTQFKLRSVLFVHCADVMKENPRNTQINILKSVSMCFEKLILVDSANNERVISFDELNDIVQKLIDITIYVGEIPHTPFYTKLKREACNFLQTLIRKLTADGFEAELQLFKPRILDAVNLIKEDKATEIQSRISDILETLIFND